MDSALSERVAGFFLHLAQERGASDVVSAMVAGFSESGGLKKEAGGD